MLNYILTKTFCGIKINHTILFIGFCKCHFIDIQNKKPEAFASGFSIIKYFVRSVQ